MYLLCNVCLQNVNDIPDRAFPAVTIQDGNAVCTNHLTVAEQQASARTTTAEELAEYIHATHARLAPAFDMVAFRTNPWAHVSSDNYRHLMVAVAGEVLRHLGLRDAAAGAR